MLSGCRRVILPGLLFLAAFVVHGVLLWIDAHPEARVLAGDERLYHESAERLSAGVEPEYTFFWPPLYPRFLALCTIFPGPSQLGIQLTQMALLALSAVLLGFIFRRLGGGILGSWLVAGMTLAYPPLAAYAHFLWPEILHLTLFCLALWIVVVRPKSLPWSVLLGGVLGLAVLTKSLLLLFIPVLLLPLLLTDDAFPRRLLRVGLALFALGVTILPTVVEEQRKTGLWALGKSGAFNLWVGLNERSPRNRLDPIVYEEYLTFQDSAPTWFERQRLLRGKIHQFFADRPLPEVLRAQASRQYFRLFDKDSFLIDMLPSGVLGRGGRGYQGMAPWLDTAIRWTSYLTYAALLVMASWGFWLYPPRGRGAWLLVAFLLYNFALFFWLHVKTRYRIPMLPCFFIYAVCWIEGWQLERSAPGTWRRVGAGLTSVILLGLAFGAAFL